MSFAQGAPTQDLSIVSSNVFLYGSSTAGNAFTVQQLSAGNVASFQTSTNATALIINPAGNVGIGTTNPTSALDVLDQNNAGIALRQYNSTDGVVIRCYRALGTIASPTAVIADSCIVGLRAFGYNGTTFSGVSAGINLNAAETFTATAQGSYIQFLTTASTTTTYSEKMRILGNGNVGIGTAIPGDVLHIYSSVGSTVRIDGGSSDPRLAFYNGASIRGRVAYSTAGFYMYFQNDAEDKMRFYNGVSGAIALQPSSGNVGIGITNPTSYKLQVSGTVGASTSFTRTTGSTGVAFAAPGTGLASTDYNLILTGANDTANRLVVFVNGSARTADNGISNVTIRNDAGSLFLGQGSNPTVIYGSLVGIGTVPTNAAFRTHISGGDSSSTLYGPNATWGAYLNVGAGNTYNAAGRASVNVSNGNLHIDCATGAFQIYLNYFQGGGNGGVNASTGCYGAFFATGDITAFSSDERLKTKVGSIENALDKVCSLTAFKYIHNETARQNGFTDDNVYVGLSAQEVQKVLPEVVKPAPFDQGTEYDVGLGKSRSGENYLTVQYERIVSLLVEALKEERAERLKVDERLARLEKLLLKE
jgi:hypothetical protein